MYSVSDLLQFQSQMASYLVSDMDDASNPKYYGFLAKDGSWYIMKNDETAKSFRYVKGDSDFITNWTNRTSLNYDYVNRVFHI